MKNILLVLFTLLSYTLMALPVEREKIIEAKITHPANLKTHNGCWDVNHFIFCHGDSLVNELPSFGYLSFNGSKWEFTPIDTLPYINMQDVAVEWHDQYLGTVGTHRYFAIANSPMIYSYSTIQLTNLLPDCQLRDSIPIPAGYIKSFMAYDSLYCVVALNQGGTHYDYNFYQLPNFALAATLTLQLKFETFCRTSNSNFKEILLVGDSLGVQRMLKYNITTGQVISDVALTSNFENSKFVTYHQNSAILFASPGDTVTNKLQYDYVSTVATTTNLIPNSGITFATTNEMMPIYYQAKFDSSPNALHNKMIAHNLWVGTFDTIINNLYCSAAHSNTFGFSSPPYSLIMAPVGSKNEVIFANGVYNLTDTVAVPSYPSWFVEDMRCYGGVNEINSRLAIHANPNPANEEISISITGLQQQVNYIFEVVSISGELLFELPVTAKKEYHIPLDEMPAGTLLLRIRGNGVSATRKIVKL